MRGFPSFTQSPGLLEPQPWRADRMRKAAGRGPVLEGLEAGLCQHCQEELHGAGGQCPGPSHPALGRQSPAPSVSAGAPGQAPLGRRLCHGEL